jgi:hypothetical protein
MSVVHVGDRWRKQENQQEHQQESSRSRNREIEPNRINSARFVRNYTHTETIPEARAARHAEEERMPERRRRGAVWRLGLRTIIPRLSILAFGFSLAANTPAQALDLDKMTVVTLARDGSWGVASAARQGEAIAEAVRDCRARPSAPKDCGAQFVTTRGGWVIANLCGDHKIIVAAESREAAEVAVLARAIDLRRQHVLDMPPCRRILTVDPRGAVLLDQAALNAPE